MQQKCFTHTSILSQNMGRTKMQVLKFNKICQFCCFIKESCRWHWLGFFLWGSRLLPGTVPSAPWDRQVALGIITKTVLASQAPCRDPGIFRAQRQHREPLHWRGARVGNASETWAVHSAHPYGVKMEESHLHTRAAIWVWPRSVKLVYEHGNSDFVQLLHATKY